MGYTDENTRENIVEVDVLRRDSIFHSMSYICDVFVTSPRDPEVCIILKTHLVRADDSGLKI